MVRLVDLLDEAKALVSKSIKDRRAERGEEISSEVPLAYSTCWSQQGSF